MKSDLNIKSIFGSIGHFVQRFGTLLFFLVVSGGLFTAIMMLLSIISLSSTTATSSNQTIDSTFDEDTIRRLKEGSSAQPTPSGRQSPFVE